MTTQSLVASVVRLKAFGSLVVFATQVPPTPGPAWIFDPFTGRPVSLSVKMFRSLSEFTPVESRSEEHTSELQSLMRTSYAVFCLKKKILISYQVTLNLIARGQLALTLSPFAPNSTNHQVLK